MVITLTYKQLSELNDALNAIKEIKMPFKLSLIIAKNASIVSKEMDFYLEQEKDFAYKYLEVDDQGQFIQEQPGVFRIKDGMQEECRSAREELDKFTIDIDLKQIPLSLIETIEFTPAQVEALEELIDEEG